MCPSDIRSLRSNSNSNSKILASVHETASGLFGAGVMKHSTMRSFNKLCLERPLDLSAKEIALIRASAHVSQALFAKYLNVSTSSICKWESGEKTPSGPSLKLLHVIQKRGIDVLF